MNIVYVDRFIEVPVEKIIEVERIVEVPAVKPSDEQQSSQTDELPPVQPEVQIVYIDRTVEKPVEVIVERVVEVLRT